MIGIVCYGAGNLTSVANAVRWLGHEPLIIRNPAHLGMVRAVILPGVGAFAYAMACLTRSGFMDPLLKWIKAGKPFLGICLGMQLLARMSTEGEGAAGLGLVQARVIKIEPRPTLPVPHMGWNDVVKIRDAVLWGSLERAVAYHVHSYHMVFESDIEYRRWVIGTTDYGTSLVTMIECDNVMAVQIHPEKSQRDGLTILNNFMKMVDLC